MLEHLQQAQTVIIKLRYQLQDTAETSSDHKSSRVVNYHNAVEHIGAAIETNETRLKAKRQVKDICVVEVVQ